VRRRHERVDGRRDPFQVVLAAARSGAPEAWQHLHRWLAPAVAGYLRVQGARDADDLASEVFLQVFRGIAAFEGDEAGFRSWVFTIAHRRLQDERRRRSRRFAEEELGDATPAPAGPAAEDDALRALALERVVATCDRLPPDQRDVVLLRVAADLSIEEVAGVLGKTPGAVKSLQHRAFANLAKLLAPEAVSP
jgi:RNA polymerase sigma-70 factor (ECF subfamily)